ncbi:spore-associated protein A [Streptomyces sp. SID11233]|nr:spore-associated protein A [Streptomyces sp. SID11233]
MRLKHIIKTAGGLRAKRRIAAVGTAGVLACGAVIAVPGTAQAAASYNGACGAGYGVIDQMDLGADGRVFLTYSSATGKNCVVTMRNVVGPKEPMQAMISISGVPNSSVMDYGSYTSYAGPVYLYARGSCVDWSGFFRLERVRYNDHCG